MQYQLGDAFGETDLALLWRGLTSATAFISQSYYADGRCFAEVDTLGGRRPARRDYVELLQRAFEGESQKSLACELGVSVATIASYCSQSLGAMCAGTWVSRAPIILVMAALAAAGERVQPARRERLSDSHYLISVQTPGARLRSVLSESEWAVARLSIEGRCHASVAASRGTSLRTIANQLAAVFTKLKVSGRAELRAKAIRADASGWMVRPLGLTTIETASWQSSPLSSAVPA
jgi:DNA-binding NarL/FixJ family response regulator